MYKNIITRKDVIKEILIYKENAAFYQQTASMLEELFRPTEEEYLEVIEAPQEEVKAVEKKKSKGYAMLKKVGQTKLGYDDVQYDIDGWADAKKYAPEPFDLVTLKTEERTGNGWFKGADWYSRKLGDNIKVLFWKRLEENFVEGPKNVRGM